MSNNQWEKEIEKKYIVSNAHQFKKIRHTAIQNGLVQSYYALQKDWIPDFDDSSMKKKGVLLRIRHSIIKKGRFPKWIVTLKTKSFHDGIHHNLELEASSENEEKLKNLEKEIKDNFGKNIDLKKVVNLDSKYVQKIGLTTHRMILEKYREEFIDSKGDLLLSFDELPLPLGPFIELESDNLSLLNYWEQKLGLDHFPIAEIDYGEMVKGLSNGKQRVLTFKDHSF